MDRRTWQALTTGYVDLPRRRVHAGVWFRLLRTLVEEVNTPLSQCGEYADDVRYVWDCSGLRLRAGQSSWRSFENLGLDIQLQMVEAAATAIEVMEAKFLRPIGEQAALFLPEPGANFVNVVPIEVQELTQMNFWRAMNAFNDVIIEAHHNPHTACFLFALLASEHRETPDSLEKLRRDLEQLGIPREYLPLNSPRYPL